MNWKTWAPLVLAVVLGLVAMKIARDVMSKNQAPQAAGNTIVVLKSDLPAGSALSIADLGTARVAGDFKSDAVFVNAADLEGRVLTVPAAKGSPVLETMLAPRGTGAGLQALIPEGMRAVTVEINEFTGLAGYLTPGSRVDVVATMNDDGNEMVSRTIVQNIRVQTVGSRTQTEQGTPVKSVTLIATPREAEAIELAATTSKPRLVLRSSTDNDTPVSDGITVAELRRSGVPASDPFDIAPAVNIAPATQPATVTQAFQPETRPRTIQRSVKIIRGGVESETTVEEIALPVGPKWITGASTDELPGTTTK